MGMEDVNKISARIEVEDSEEKEVLLSEKINQISLIYADKKFKELKKEISDYKFSDAIRCFTPIERYITKVLDRLEDFDFGDYQDKINIFFEDFFREVNEIYEMEGLNMEAILNLVKLKRESIKQYLSVEGLKTKENKERTLGTKLLNSNEITGVESDGDDRVAMLLKIGFSNLDRFIEIHVEDFYKTGQENLGTDLIKEDLAKVAVAIVDMTPETAAVIGRSWLLDTPLAERLGFIKIGDNTSSAKENDLSVWLQFVDKEGQVNQKRFSKFCESGKLPFRSVSAYIPVEDFLRRYLPENYRGKKITLKKINKQKESHVVKIMERPRVLKLDEVLKSDWKSLITGVIDFESFINNENTKQIFSIYGEENEKLIFDFFIEMYEKKVSWENFPQYQSFLDLKEVLKILEGKIKESIYESREVIIE